MNKSNVRNSDLGGAVHAKEPYKVRTRSEEQAEDSRNLTSGPEMIHQNEAVGEELRYTSITWTCRTATDKSDPINGTRQCERSANHKAIQHRT